MQRVVHILCLSGALGLSAAAMAAAPPKAPPKDSKAAAPLIRYDGMRKLLPTNADLDPLWRMSSVVAAGTVASVGSLLFLWSAFWRR